MWELVMIDVLIESCFADLYCVWMQSLELWNMAENRSMTLPAHDGLIAALAVSNATGMVASASHDKCVKLWKWMAWYESENFYSQVVGS